MASAVLAPPTDFFSQIITMMKRTIHWLIALVAAMPLLATAQDAQFVPYRGGSSDGHAASTLSGFTAGYISSFTPFAGGHGSGYNADSLQRFDPLSGTLMFSPFAGGQADGAASDSLISFDARGFALLFSPFVGGAADGYASDSLIAFDQRAFIAMYGPFAGGQADGYYEGVLCNYPKATADTVVFLPCSNSAFDLTTLVENYNFAARWNTARPDSAVAGTYELRINNAGKCLDTMQAVVRLDVATWTGAMSTNWHDAANWSTNQVPGVFTHVIIPSATPNACIISTMDAVCASVQARTGGNIRIENDRLLLINGRCTQLPAN
jgi:hypothetical protein